MCNFFEPHSTIFEFPPPIAAVPTPAQLLLNAGAPAEGHRVRDELGASGASSCGTPRVVDGLVGEIDGAGDILCGPTAEAVSTARWGVAILKEGKPGSRPRCGRGNIYAGTSADVCGRITAPGTAGEDDCYPASGVERRATRQIETSAVNHVDAGIKRERSTTRQVEAVTEDIDARRASRKGFGGPATQTVIRLVAS